MSSWTTMTMIDGDGDGVKYRVTTSVRISTIHFREDGKPDYDDPSTTTHKAMWRIFSAVERAAKTSVAKGEIQ